jgi:hypothetical protein
MRQTKDPARTVLAMRLCGVALGLVGLALMPAEAPAATAPKPSSALKAEIESNYGKLPLSFEANQGQTDSQVKFLARGRGYALFLTPTEAVLSLAKPQAQAHAETSATSSPEASGTVLAMQLSGANPEPQVTGNDALPGRVNYLRGKDPAHWHTQIPTYAKVAYEGIYPGVDLVYYGNQGQLEYDFVVAPGADPGALKLVFRGADRIEIKAAGELVLSTASGDIRMHAPVIYQETAGVRTTVAGGYVLKEPQQVSFEVAAYDTSRPLVIDPMLVYSTYLGGSGFDRGDGIAVDDGGNAYVTGGTISADFPTVNAVQPAFAGGETDAFVAKLTPNGGQLLYSTYLGGSGFDNGFEIAADNSGNAYVAGGTASADFPTVNAVQPAFAGGENDAFVAKLTPNGGQLLYSTYLGGRNNEFGFGIVVDIRGNAYVTGFTASTDFPTVNAVQPALGGDIDAFVAKLTPNGSQLLYSTYLGGNGFDRSFGGIVVDVRGNAYVAGGTASTDFPTVNAVQPAIGGESDAFVAKLTPNGSQLLYSTYLGGNGGDESFAIAVDNSGNAYVTGSTASADFPTVNAVQPALGGDIDAFVAKLTPNGSQLLYSTYLGGSGFDSGFEIAADDRGNAYVAGRTASTDFPTVNAVQPAFAGGEEDAFVAKLMD